MNITNLMESIDDTEVRESIKAQVVDQVEDMRDSEFFDAYYESGHNGFDNHLDMLNIEVEVCEEMSIGDSEEEQAFLQANIDQVLDSDWFDRYIEDEADGRKGEIAKRRTDQSAFTMEKNTIANKYG